MKLLRSLWQRLKVWVRGLVGHLTGAGRARDAQDHDLGPAQASLPAATLASAYTLKGSASDSAGRLDGAPMLLPAREFLLHVPRGHRPQVAAPLVIWLHGCRQSAEAFRDGTRIHEWADQRGLLVLMPMQSSWANPYGCWNWFDPATQRGGGEAALVLAQMRQVRSQWPVDAQRIWIAGMSSGAALAACVAAHGRRDIRAAAFVAGLASGAARSAATALDVMQHGPDHDVAQSVPRPSGLAPLDALIIHGASDTVVAPLHARSLARQMLALNGEWPVLDPLRPPDQTEQRDEGGHRLLSERYRLADGHRVELLHIQGLGHAWSGGDTRFEYNDGAPPDATRLILDFFAASAALGQH